MLEPTAAVGRDGRIELFVVGSNQTVLRSVCDELPCNHRFRFSDWHKGPGAPPSRMISRLSATVWGQGRYDLFVVGRDGHLWHQTRAGTRFMGWEDLGGNLRSAPAATSWSDGRIDVFAAWQGEEIQQRYCQATGPLACRGSSWSPWVRIPGRPPAGFVGDPVASSPSANHIDVAVTGRDGAVWYVGYQNGWGGWQSLGGLFVGRPALAAVDGRTVVFARDISGRIWKTSGSQRTFEPFRPLDATVDEPPVAVASQSRVELFARAGGGETLSHLSCEGDLCVLR